MNVVGEVVSISSPLLPSHMLTSPYPSLPSSTSLPVDDLLACGFPPLTGHVVGAGTGPTEHFTSLNEANKLKPHPSMVICLYLDARLGSSWGALY